jgi:hypothetical protein
LQHDEQRVIAAKKMAVRISRQLGDMANCPASFLTCQGKLAATQHCPLGLIMKLFTILLSILISTAAVADRHGNSTTGAEHGMSGDNPFILIARVQVKKGMVEEYLRIAEAVDNAVEKTEPGMLFHNFDADPDDPLAFTGLSYTQTAMHSYCIRPTRQCLNM